MKRAASILLLAALPCFLPACSDDSPDDGNGGGGDDGGGGGDPGANYTGAKGVTITDLAIYQSLKRPLALDGTSNGVPLVAGKDAAIRVFYATDGSYDGKAVKVRLDIDDGGDPIELNGSIGIPVSTEENVASTLNLFVPGDRIGATFTYQVSVLQEGVDSDDNTAARWPPSGMQAIAVEGPVNKMRVILAPFQYNADGSGRLPDTSAETVELYRNRLRQLYPVSDVEVTVRQAVPWNQQIDAFGGGWQAVGIEVFGMRAEDGTSDDVYYYGLFVPEPSFQQYCAGGCLLGVTLLNNDPPDVGSVDLRLALGIGYVPVAYDTFAHELGHSHGREHAPCGMPMPDGIDPQYPHAGGQIGVWGMDPAVMQLYPPTAFTDVMGYCDNTWISDYTYKALLNRGKNVNLPAWHEATSRPKQKVAVVSVDGHGSGIWGGFTLAPSRAGGRALPTTLVDAYGRRETTLAHYYEYDHLPGGMAVVQVADEHASEVEVEIDGVVHVIQRTN